MPISIFVTLPKWGALAVTFTIDTGDPDVGIQPFLDSITLTGPYGDDVSFEDELSIEEQQIIEAACEAEQKRLDDAIWEGFVGSEPSQEEINRYFRENPE